jgi:hypothetical protein
MKYKNTIQKYLPIALLIININTSFSMEYISELKNNAQEFWSNANALTKTAVILGLGSASGYILLSELRNNWNKARIRELEEKAVQNAAKTDQTLQVVGAMSGDLYDTCPSAILQCLSLDETFIDEETGKHIFKNPKNRNKLVKKTGSAKNHYKGTFSTLLNKRNKVQFGSEETTGNTLVKQIEVRTTWLYNITAALGVKAVSGHVPEASFMGTALHMKIAATIATQCVTQQTIDGITDRLNKRIDGIANGLNNAGALLLGEGNSYLLYDSKLEKYPERRKQYWEDTLKRTLKQLQEIPDDSEKAD